MATEWYDNAVMYGIDVSRFHDANNDGSGDLQGVTEKLDYIAGLGVNCLWLLPFMPSDRRDNGYDVTNFMNIDPDLGTLSEFQTLVQKAHQRNIKVMIDLPIHHTSAAHPWFVAATTSKNSPYRDYYVWADTPPDNPNDTSVFPGEEGGVWEYCEPAQSYYHHKFYDFEPDLNVANPAVWNELKQVFAFWLSFDVDGFRIDAATHIFREKGLPGTGVDAGQYMHELRALVDSYKKDVLLLGEADVTPGQITEYFGQGHRLNMLYNFLLNNALLLGLARADATPIATRLHEQHQQTGQGAWLNFLRNLDEIDLEQLSERERSDVFETFAPEQNMRIYGRGIRLSIPSMLQDPQQLRMAYSLTFSLPGAIMFTYGSEIGLGDDLSLPGRSSVRLPMEWDTVDAQQHAGDSLYTFFQKLIHFRTKHPSLGGDYHIVKTGSDAVLGLAYGDLVALHNLSNEPQPIDIGAPIGKVLFGNLSADNTLQPYGFAWLQQKELA